MAHVKSDITDDSRRRIESDAHRADRVIEVLRDGLMRGAQTMAAHVQEAYFTGYRSGVERSSKLAMVFNRTGLLRQSIVAVFATSDGLAVLVGVPSGGPASRYAAAILGDELTEIEPTQADFLTIPMQDNLNPSGLTKQTAREAIDSGGWFYRPEGSGGDQLFIVKRRGKTTKSKLLFLFHLVRRVEIQGTDALWLGMMDKVDDVRAILQRGIHQLYREGAL